MDKREKARIFRERFYGRQDLYGTQFFFTDQRGERKKGFAPKCNNLWTDKCHIKLKDGVTCAKCEIKQYLPNSDEATLAHISGDEPQLIYLVHDGGLVKFAAFDFDRKPGKEHLGYDFKDVKLVSNKLNELGISHAVARSTGSETLYGHHLYMFFDELYPAGKVMALSTWIFEEVGFYEQVRLGIRPLLEFFPKQSSLGGIGPGNGIKPPMIEKNWIRERNGFVDENDVFIPPQEQWNFLNETPRISTTLLNKVMDDLGIQPEEDNPYNSPGRASGAPRRNRTGPGAGTWQHPLTGSFEKVIEGCAAIRRIFEKAQKGEVPGHHEGFATYHLAMQCADGLDIFKQRMTGWGTNERDQHQLDHSIQKDYAPWTCKKLQEVGICHHGTKCFDKKPPIILVEGRYIQDTSVPPSQWSEPSPIRYAFGKGDDFLEKLKTEINELLTEDSDSVKMGKVKDIAKRAQVFDEAQQKELKEFIKSTKILKARELSKIFNTAANEHEKDIKEKASTRTDTIVVDDNTYQLVQPHGYSVLKRVRNVPEFVQISSCTIEIKEERKYLDDDEVVRTVYFGSLNSSAGSIPFEIDALQWYDTTTFIQFFGVLGGSAFTPLRSNVELVKQAAMGFAKKTGYTKSNFLMTQGWYQDTYLMPSVKVDKSGITENNEQVVEMSRKPHSSFLGFKILETDYLKEVLLHIKSDFLNAWPRRWTTVMLAHTMLAAITGPLRIRKKPTLFFEGLTGTGKTELTHTAQYFWGEFESLVNLTSTPKGLMAVAHDFKDCLLVFDDYKGLDYQQIMALQNVIQYSYDPNSSVKLNRDSSIRKPKGTRGVLCFTGESFVTNDAAMVARTILIEVEKQDTSKTRDKYQRCLEYRKDYSGVTPHFIHWFLNQDVAKFLPEVSELQRILYGRLDTLNNADRISYNLALNHTMWRWFISFLCDLGACTIDEKDELWDEHWGYICTVQAQMVSRCTDDQNGAVFLRVLLQLISSGEATILGYNDGEGMPGYAKKNIIGYVWHGQLAPCVNLYPDIVFKVVKAATRDNAIRGTEREFGRQFADMGLLLDTDEGRNRKLIQHNGQRNRVWVFNMDKLGLYSNGSDKKLSVVRGGRDIKIDPDTVAISDVEGTY